MNIRTVYDLKKVSFSKDNVINLMVSLEAPPLPENFKRNSAFIVACLDCSGSMMGDKMESLKQTMYKLIDNLTTSDKLGIVWFGGHYLSVERIEPVLMDSAGKEVMKNVVSNKQAGGGTPLLQGVTSAFTVFGARKDGQDVVERVILLTDGQADTSADTYDLVKKALVDSRGDITMSCFGYGADYNEVLLETLSKDYRGGNYFVDDVKMLPEAFAQELGSLLSCYATDIKVSAVSNDLGIVPEDSISVLNDMPNSTSSGKFEVKAGDLFYGEKKRIFLRIKTKALPEAKDSPLEIVSVEISSKMVEGGVTEETKHTPSISFVPEDEVDLEPDAEVAEQVLVMDAAKTQVEAKDLADQGEWQQAKAICDKMIENLDRYGSAYTKSFAAVMKESSSGFESGYARGGMMAKCASTASYTVLRGGRGSSGGKMKDFAAMAYGTNAMTMSLINDFSDDDKKDPPEDKKNA